MDMNRRQETGILNISEAVIEKIANTVVEDVDGVYSLYGGSGTSKGLFRAGRKKPVKLKITAGVATIDVSIVIRYGCRIKEVAEQVQQSIKESVQNMTSVAVAKVNVFVRGVQIEE